MGNKKEIIAIKRLILDTVYKTNVGHITSSFSCVEILYAVYKYANLKGNISNRLRDRVIISKEHCRLAQVCILAHLGFLDGKNLSSYCVSGGTLGHDLYNFVSEGIDAVDYASGSLGHGLSVGAGMAFGDIEHHYYVLLGDAELQEGSIFEALLFIIQQNIKNMTVIVDLNQLQIDNYTKNIIDTKALDLFNTLGFSTFECDGHNVLELTKQLSISCDKPKCIIAHTIKGKGIEFLLNELNFAQFHHSALTQEQYCRAYEAINS